eukprot:32117_1
MAHSFSEHKTRQAPPDTRTDLYVSNLPFIWTDDHLRSYFNKYHPRRTHILRNKDCGFVNFQSHEHAARALTELNNKRPHPTAMPLWIKYARRNSMQSGAQNFGVNHNTFWKDVVDEKGRVVKKERDLDKLQNLIAQSPRNARYHYEYSCGLASHLDTKIKRTNKSNTVRKWLHHMNTAIQLTQNQNANNKPTFAWIKRKVEFCIRLYNTDDNCYNIDMNDLLRLTWNAVTQYNRYYFYLLYVRLLHTTQREELVTEAYKLSKAVWDGDERTRYFQRCVDYTNFVKVMIQNGCALGETLDVMTACMKFYYKQFGNDFIAREDRSPAHKSATFALHLMVVKFAMYICIEYDWNVDRRIVFQCVQWLETVISLRPRYATHYIHLSYCHFFVLSNYAKARMVIETAAQKGSEQGVYDELVHMMEEIKANNASNEKKWNTFEKWITTKILKNIDRNVVEEVVLNDEEMLNQEPGCKLNIALVNV